MSIMQWESTEDKFKLQATFIKYFRLKLQKDFIKITSKELEQKKNYLSLIRRIMRNFI
jgi:hypothetical protein